MWLALALALAWTSAPAQAQGPAGAQERRGDGVEEITVTARKREERLQDTPVAVTAFGSAALEQITATRIDDVGRYVPNLRFDTAGGNSAASRVQIRGVGNPDPIVSRDPGVGVYVDGVYLSRAQGSLLATADLERIEVLRGPQGTLFGRNTVGGAINVITRRPDDEPGADLALRLGSYDTLETRASLNLPIVPERVLSRVSLATQTRDGFTHNLLDGERSDDNKLLAARAVLRIFAAEGVVLDLAGDASKRHQNNRGAQCRYDADAPASTGILPNGVMYPSLPTLLNAHAGFSDVCNASAAFDELDFASETNGEIDEDTQGLAATLDWELSDAVGLKWIHAWRRQETGFEQEFDYTPTLLGRQEDRPGDQSDQISSELNLSGTGLDGRLQWTSGAYFFREKSNAGLPISSIGIDLADLDAADLSPLVQRGVLVGTPLLNLLGFDGPFDIASFSEQNDIANTNFAGYGQLSYDLTDRLSLTAGARRLVERKQIHTRRFAVTGSNLLDPVLGPIQIGTGPDQILNGAPCSKVFEPGCDVATRTVRSTDDTPLDVERSDRFDAWTGLLNLQYRLSDERMVYAQWASGYKSGGFNGRLNPADLDSQAGYDPEKLDSYELGLKSSWLGGSLIANVALFQSRYDEIQQTALEAAPDGSFAALVRNAGKATVRGVELELRSRPLDGLDLEASFGFLDADYDENRRELDERGPGPDGLLNDFICGNGLMPDPAACGGDANDPTSNVVQDPLSGRRMLVSVDDEVRFRDFKRERFGNTPNFSMTLSAAYAFETRLGVLTPRVSWYHQNAITYTGSRNNESGEQGTLGVLSGRISLELEGGVTEIALYGANLLDRRYINDAISFDDSFAFTSRFYAPPRTYGVEVRRTFGGF